MVASAVLTATVSVVLLLSVLTMLFWLYEQYLGLVRYDVPEIEHAPDAAQVRILTVGTDPTLIQRTVGALPDAVDDIRVITEKPLAVEGATAHVVPSSFDCIAEKKGRALEWARRNVDCDREFVLYLDEDSRAGEFEGLPDADIVQFGEKPFKTDSLLTYWVEIFRMGFQIEMRGFYEFDVPLYAWGGGIAVRTELEEAVTWNFESIVEDTSFVWRAATDRDVEFAYCKTKFRNQAPPSLSALVQQRRRWFAGSVAEIGLLPRRFFALSALRNGSWVLSMFVPVLVIALLFPLPLNMPYLMMTVLSTVGGAVLLSWSVIGCRYMDEGYGLAVVILLVAPILSVINAIGALYGTVRPPDGFTVTEKTTNDEIVQFESDD